MTYNIDFSKYLHPEKEVFSNRPMEQTTGLYLNFLDDCDKILDVGCGTGNTVKYLQSLGREAVGITFSPLEIDQAKMFNTVIQQGEMHRLDFKDEEFDAVISWDNLEHAIAPFIALSEMKRVVKVGGKLLIYIPDLQWLENENHFYQLNIRQMKHLINRVGGLEIVDIITRVDEDGIYKLKRIK